MRFSFIPDGNVWQEFVSRLLTADSEEPRSRCRGFEPISSDRLGDYGLDGLDCGFGTSPTGTVFQMSFPLWEPGEPLHTRVNKKLTETCRKLKRNADVVREVMGTRVTRLVLVIPEDQDVKVRAHKERLEAKTGLKIEVWGRTKVAKLLSKHPNAVRDLLPFPVERPVDTTTLITEGERLAHSGRYAEARDYYAKAEFYSLLYADTKALREAKTRQAGLAYDIGDIGNARLCADEAVVLARTADPEALPKTLVNAADMAIAAGHDRRAASLLREATEYAREQGADARLADIRLRQALLAFKRGNTKAAKRLVRACRTAYSEKEGTGLANLLDLEARLASRDGDGTRAVRLVEEAIRVVESSNTESPAVAGRFAMRLADLLLSEQKPAEALRALEKAATCFSSAELLRDHLLARVHAAQTLLLMGRAEEAAPLLSALSTRAGEAELHYVVGVTGLLRAQIAAESGAWEDALKHAHSAYEEFVLERNIPNQVSALLLMGRIAEQAGEIVGAEDMLTESEQFRTRALEQLEQATWQAPPDLVIGVRTELARARELRGEFEGAIAVLEATSLEALSQPDQRLRLQETVAERIAACREKARVRDLLSDIAGHCRPLEWAKTEGARTVSAAHAKVFSDLLDAMDVWPGSEAGLLDFWGRGNFARLLLSHQAAEKGLIDPAFTLAVEITSVEQARLACRIFYPIVDCLVLVWKGAVEEGKVLVPMRGDVIGPGGWGYIAASSPHSAITPAREHAGTWYPTIGFGLFLPREIVEMVFIEARRMVEKGRLVLVPASVCGCEYEGHGYLERLLVQRLLGASPILVDASEGGARVEGFPVVVPFFPEAPLADLASMVDDNEEALIGVRKACLEWGIEVDKDGGDLSTARKQWVCAHVREAMSHIERAFRSVAGRMPANGPFGLTASSLRPSALPVPPVGAGTLGMGPAASGLYSALGKDAKPWYPFWQLTLNLGGHWLIAGPRLPPPRRRPDPDKTFVSDEQKVSTHWMQSPDGSGVGYLVILNDSA